MSGERRGAYRSALQVSPERIALLTDSDLNLLMGRLLRAEAYRCGAPVSEIRLNTEEKAADDGCDAWSPAATRLNDWFANASTCWQFKAGTAGQPKRIRGEVIKRIPKETIECGGRFVLVASGSTNGKKGEDERLQQLCEEAAAQGLPVDNINVVGSERLTAWCNEHPAVAAHWAGRPEGLCPLDRWCVDDEHQVSWQGSAAVDKRIDELRAQLDFIGGTLLHLHIHGLPGVGKSRFALELCRGAPWSSTVVYVRQASDFRLAEVLDSVAAERWVRLVVVADEVQLEQLRPLRDSVGRADGRVRLITIGHCPTPDLERIPAVSLSPLGRQAMAAIITGWHPAMPQEHVDFVVRFADGYVRLAKLAAHAVRMNPLVYLQALLARDDIRTFLDRLLGPDERRSLHVLAVLDSVGWSEDKAVEGQAIAKHLGLKWNQVRDAVEQFHRRLGIAPAGGRYRYLSPKPLGIYLAAEAWATYPDLLRTLPSVLPTEAALDAYYSRLESLPSQPHATRYAQEELSGFGVINDFTDERAVRRWAALAAADPDRAAANFLRAIAKTTVDERRKIHGGARRRVVSALARLAWRSSSFRSATRSLALLAETEEDSCSSSATSEFIARFQVILGGTAVPYVDRLQLLDELLEDQRPKVIRLAIKALSQVGDFGASRCGGEPLPGQPVEVEWEPRTERAHLACVQAGLERLIEIAKCTPEDLQDELVAACSAVSSLLRDEVTRPLAIRFFDGVRTAHPETREALRVAIARVIDLYDRGLDEPSTDAIDQLDKLHARFEDSALASRLRQQVGPTSWDQDKAHDFGPLARDVLAAPDILTEQWPWLTSGEAPSGWRFGEALAEVDSEATLANSLPHLDGGGSDLRFLCGYIARQRKAHGDNWYDAWLSSQMDRSDDPNGLLFRVAWRCGVTDTVAQLVIRALRTTALDRELVSQFENGRWCESLEAKVLEAILRAMMDTGHQATVIAVLEHRLKAEREDFGQWRQLALELAVVSHLIRSDLMTSHYWKEVACRLAPDHPGEIAAAILREKANREDGSFFLEGGYPSDVLYRCVHADPQAVWKAMIVHLGSWYEARMFSIGFAKGVVDHLPQEDILAWVAEDPTERAVILAGLVSPAVATDDMLASKLIAAFGDVEGVSSTLFSEYISGRTYHGLPSVNWDRLAEQLEAIRDQTALSRLRQWASDSAQSLRKMAERDRLHEEERNIRGW